MKIAIVSGNATNVGKTSLADSLFAPRLQHLTRLEIEKTNTGSSKEGVNRITAAQLPDLRNTLLDMEDDENLLIDVGGSQFDVFMTELQKFRSTTSEIDLFVVVMAAGLKEGDVLAGVRRLIELGAVASKVVVLFNKAPFADLEDLRAKVREDYADLISIARKAGFRIIETPVVEAEDVYKLCFSSATWTPNKLADAPSFRQEMKKLRREGQPIPEPLQLKELAQEQCRSFVVANLDAVWAELDINVMAQVEAA